MTGTPKMPDEKIDPDPRGMAERGIMCLIRNHRYEIEKARRITAERAGVHVRDNLRDAASAPIGTTVVFPAVQDEHHPRQIAIRWAPPWDLDEECPWLIMGSEGPQRLSNDVVEGCEVLAVPLADACATAIPDCDA
jgi:hypothetical protein